MPGSSMLAGSARPTPPAVDPGTYLSRAK
jgi:hypothetical protein